MTKQLGTTDQNNTPLRNVPAPSASGDAANKAYVDAQTAAKVTGTTKITVGTTAPSNPAAGDLWVDTN
jgi:hypothetical protein